MIAGASIVKILLDSMYCTLRKENEREIARELPDDGMQLAQSVVCNIYSIECVSAPSQKSVEHVRVWTSNIGISLRLFQQSLKFV